MSEGAIPIREANEPLPDRKFELKRDGASWLVTADDAVIGRLERVVSALANLGKSKTKPTFNANGYLWQASPDGAELDHEDAANIARALTRKKRTRATAVRYLVDAYAEVGVALPPPIETPISSES